MKTTYQQRFEKAKAITAALVISLVPLVNTSTAGAAAIMGRSITMSSSAAGATSVTYDLASDSLPTPGTIVKSVEVKFCTSLTDSCASTPSGMVTTGSSLASQPSGLGAAGWTNSTTAGALRITNSANDTTPSGAVAISWDGVTNPSDANTTFYAIVTTYSNADWTGAIDTGSMALSTSSQVQVQLTVGETLTFCAGTSITGENCGTISGGLVNLGQGSTTSASTGTSVIAASTNGDTGYTITVSGDTLTSGSNTIDALATGGTSSPGSKQFGLNLIDNTDPNVGAAKSGSGTGAATTDYDDDGVFRLNPSASEVIASAAGPTNANAFTVSYMANIDGMTPAGVYSTVLTYTATANF